MADAPRLIADIGGTNARFALQTGAGEPRSVRVLQAADFPNLKDAAAAYLADIKPPSRPRQAAIAVASPVTGDRVEFTNSPWSFSVAALKSDLGLDALHVVNDFIAVALSIMKLRPEDGRQIGGGQAIPATPISVLGPGTGLGVSGLVPAETGWVPLATEGGHVSLATVTPREDAVLVALHKRFDHVSAERTVSGPGIRYLYEALCEIDGRAPKDMTPDTITSEALTGSDPACAEALSMFCDMLGTVAGNLALSHGARGGVFIAGGIVPDFIDYFERSGFRKRFEAKGRFQPYMAAIPTYVITRENPAFLGLAAVLEANAGGMK